MGRSAAGERGHHRLPSPGLRCLIRCWQHRERRMQRVLPGWPAAGRSSADFIGSESPPFPSSPSGPSFMLGRSLANPGEITRQGKQEVKTL